MHDLDRGLWELGDDEFRIEQEAIEMAAESAGWLDRTGSALADNEETDLALRLLEVGSDQELTQWVGGLIGRAAEGARDFLSSDTGQMLGAMAKGAVKEGLPVIGQKIGEHYGGAGSIWGTVGQRAGKGLAAALFEVDLEGLSAEDQQLETARAAVRFIDAATRCAVAAPADLPPQQAARRAFTLAARRYAPGLAVRTAVRGREARSGRWVRRGQEIVIFER